MPPQLLAEAPDAAREIAALTVNRKGRSDDHDFIFSSWLSSMRDAACGSMMPQVGGRVSREVFEEGQRQRIARLLADPTTKVMCRSFVDDLSISAGWAIARGDCLHYVFVKTAWRRKGISRLLVNGLLPNGAARFSCRTSAGNSFVVPHLGGATFDPYAIDPRKA